MDPIAEALKQIGLFQIPQDPPEQGWHSWRTGDWDPSEWVA